ncbi:MAG TPA: ubiquinol oxidase subunit II [Candidatus Saccharimonadia bacterium]|nr:ubiquinol oxidase subunit II [Candidatus Saccharimonadia bacterium]
MAKKQVNKNQKRAFVAVLVLWFIGIIVWYLHAKNFAVLNPAGEVASKERDLMFVTVGLGLLVVIPVYIMTFTIAWRYREGNKKARYQPELTGNRWVETVWWGVPILIIGILSVITWNSSHALDPRKALDVAGKPLNVHVVALDWKWLFIYPEQGVASVNQMEVPVGRPVNFTITADAPMNSFWIPQLGSQIYAMPGMQTHLNLVADKAGIYQGSSANLSGDGFAGMRFQAIAGPQQEFNDWVQSAKNAPGALDLASYDHLAKPSQYNPVAFYSSIDPQLFSHVLLKYMVPGVN